jgi:tetratricopeptide (TPR) repeat protein
LLTWSVLAVSCSEPKPEPVRETLKLRFAGCAEWLRDGICEVAPGSELTFWIASASPTAIEIAIDGRLQSAAALQVEGGARVRVKVPKGAGQLELRYQGRVFRSGLRNSEPSAVLEQARTLRAAGRYADARVLLTPFRDSKQLEFRARVRGLLARLYLSEGDADGALAALDDASACAREAGLVQAEAANYVARADVLKRLRWDLAGAHEALSHVPDEAHEFVVSALQMKASLALVAGDLRGALRLARAAVRDAERLGLPSIGTLAAHVELLALAELGRIDEGRAKYHAILRRAADPCERGRALANGSWLELIAGGDAQQAQARAYEAAQLFSEACKDAWEEQNARVNLALALFKLDELSEARSALKAALELGETHGWVRAWQDELDAQLDLRGGKVERAIARFTALARREAQGGPVASHFRALLGLGRALLAHGDRSAAERALREAEDRLDLEVRTAPFGASRDAFTASRLASATLLIDMLIDDKRAGAALDIARRARIRPLSGLARRGRVDAAQPERRAAWERAVASYQRARETLDELHRATWRTPLDEQSAHDRAQQSLQQQMTEALEAADGLMEAEPWTMTSPAEGVLDLYFFVTERGPLAFARSSSEVVAKRFAGTKTSGQELARVFVDAFAERIRSARELRIVPYGQLRNVDFQALPFDGAALIDRLPVRYGIDVVSRAVSGFDGKGTALLVFDPRGDLPGARREGALIAAHLREQYATVVTLSGSKATLAHTRDALERARWFHFAGHGRGFATERGDAAELKLAEQAILDAGDILALKRVPETVVLAGCETGVDDEHVAFGWGMAQAFVVRGAQGVVATQRMVSDEAATAFAQHFYANTAATLARRSQQASQAMREAFRGEWSAFRLYTP